MKFFVDHEHKSTPLGDTDTTLELVDSDVGLGFRLKLNHGDLDRLAGREQMSVCYTEHDVETRTMQGETVRLIMSATLIEISAVFKGAVKQTHGVVRDAVGTGRLQDDVKGRFASDSAAIAFTRALRKLL